MDQGRYIIGRENDRCVALVRREIAAVADCLSDDLVFCHSSGSHETKASLIAKLSSGEIEYLSASSSDETVQLFNGLCLLHSRFRADVVVKGRQVVIDNQSLSAWADESGTWRQVAYQPTPLKSA